MLPPAVVPHPVGTTRNPPWWSLCIPHSYLSHTDRPTQTCRMHECNEGTVTLPEARQTPAPHSTSVTPAFQPSSTHPGHSFKGLQAHNRPGEILGETSAHCRAPTHTEAGFSTRKIHEERRICERHSHGTQQLRSAGVEMLLYLS